MTIRMLLLPMLLAGVGCSGEAPPLSMATTPERSREVLVVGFDAWKSGTTQKDLAKQSPPIFLGDDDFYRGWKLIDYKIEGEPKVIGTGLSYVLSLTIQEPGKPAPTTRKRAYRIVTAPNIAITKEDGISP